MEENKPQDTFLLTDRVVLITGGAGLIGAGFSRLCAEKGAKVVIVDMDEVRAQEVVENIKNETKNQNVFFEKCDITSEKAVTDMVASVNNKFGSIDGLVNGAFPRNANWANIPFEEVTYGDFCENVNWQLGGNFLMTREVAKVMEKQMSGAIVNLGSIYGVYAPKFDVYEGTSVNPMSVAYFAIKGGTIHLTKYWAAYLGKYNIRVNTLSPGGVFDNQAEDFVKQYSAKVPLGKRMANVDDLTSTLVYLLSDASKYVTGQNIIVDGGFGLS